MEQPTRANDAQPTSWVGLTLAEQTHLLDLSNDAIIVRDVHDRILYWNQGATELYGWTRNEALGQNLHTLLRTEGELPLEQLLATLHQQDRMEGDVVQVTRDGRRITTGCRWALDQDAGGCPSAILTTYHDITEKRQAEAAVQGSEARFRALVTQAAVGIAQTADGRFTYVNDRFCDITGRSRDNVLGQTVGSVTHPDDAERDMTLLRRMYETGESFVVDQRYLRPDGSVVWALNSVTPLRDHDGTIVGGFAASVDVTDRKRAEAALRESEARYRTLVEHFPNGSVFLFDQDLRYTLAGGTGLRAAGLTPELVEGKTLDELFPPDIAARDEPYLRAALRGEPSRVDVAFGTQTYVVHTLPVTDAQGTIVGGLVMTQDMTARAQAEAALRESEERYRALAELSPDATCVTLDGRFVYANWVAARLLRARDPQDLIGLSLAAIAAPDDLALMPERMHQVLEATGTAQPVEMCWHRRDGTIVEVETAAAAVPWQGRLAMQIIFRDITDRKQAEAALRESEARFRAIANLVPDLLWSTDPSGQPTWYNQRWYDYTGQPHADAQAADWLDVIHPEDREPSRRAFQRAMETGEPVRLEHRMRGADGSYRWFLVQARPMYDDAGRMVRWYGAATDTHQERLALEEAEAALMTRNHFVSIASHELRTPLTALIGYADLLSKATAQGPDYLARKADQIMRQAQRLNQLITQLLDVSRLQHGQFVIEPQPTDLAALVAQIVDDVRTMQPPTTQQLIALHGGDAPVLIMGDPNRLEQVIQNLLSNAVKYSPQGGQIQVRVVRMATDVVVEVSDQGIGIPAADHARLFEPFYRASNGGTHAKGFGLGLHIVREIVQRHGGRIEVESTEGQGSIFRITLPQPASPRPSSR